MSSKSDDPSIIGVLETLPALLAADGGLGRQGRMLNVECLIGLPSIALHLSIVRGQIAAVERGPLLMRSWDFAYRASATAFCEYWQPMPRPGWHDLLALTKRGEAVLEGDLYPFISHLQYFKDLLALPRGRFQGERHER
jgi:hypothetical protein